MLKTKILILLIFTFLTTTFVNAQEADKPKEPAKEATLEETFEFIERKILENTISREYEKGSFFVEESIKYDYFRFESKKVEYKMKYKKLKIYNNNSSFTFTDDCTTIVKFNLADIDPSRIGYSKYPLSDSIPSFIEFSVFIETFNKRNSIQVKKVNCTYSTTGRNPFTENKDEESVENSLSIVLKDEEIVKRIAKAFHHAVTLSGGKETKKDPF